MEKKYWAGVDEAGVILGFYVSDIYPTQPQGTVDITEAQYNQFFADQAIGKINKFVNGALVAPE